MRINPGSLCRFVYKSGVLYSDDVEPMLPDDIFMYLGSEPALCQERAGPIWYHHRFLGPNGKVMTISNDFEKPPLFTEVLI